MESIPQKAITMLHDRHQVILTGLMVQVASYMAVV